jgi:hypothetical protein
VCGVLQSLITGARGSGAASVWCRDRLSTGLDLL